MFMVFSKDKIVSYLISLSTVAFLFIMSFAITKRNDEILKTSANVVEQNNVQENMSDNNLVEENNSLNEIKESKGNIGNITKKLQK